MASLRGGQLLWGTALADADAVTVSQNGVSNYAVIGPGPYVAVYIKNTGGTKTATFKVQVTGSDDPRAGLNFLDTTQVGGGVDWFDLDGHTSLVVAPGSAIAFDLAPFSAPLMRLVRTDSTGDTTILALVTSFGPN